MMKSISYYLIFSLKLTSSTSNRVVGLEKDSSEGAVLREPISLQCVGVAKCRGCGV